MAAKDKGRKAVAKKAQSLGQLTIEYVPIGDVSPNDYNPNRQSEHDYGLLIKSIEEDGFTQPVVAVRITDEMVAEGENQGHDAGSVVIVDGEHRWRAARDLGFEEIPVALVPMGLTQAKIATLRHNRARGSEDVELSAQLLRDLQEVGALDWAQDSLMLSDVEINRLIEDIPAPEALAGEEFADAWTPVSGQPHGADGAVAGTKSIDLGDRTTAATATAADRQRDLERRIAAAKTEEEREAVARDRSIYRLVLAFADAEADVVREVLGDEPAEKLLELCRGALPAGWSPPEPVAAEA